MLKTQLALLSLRSRLPHPTWLQEHTNIHILTQHRLDKHGEPQCTGLPLHHILMLPLRRTGSYTILLLIIRIFHATTALVFPLTTQDQLLLGLRLNER